MRSLNLKSQKQSLDIGLLTATFALLLFGLVMIYDASVVAAFRDFGDKLFYFKNQLIWASIGTVALAFFSIFDYHKLVKLSPKIIAVALVFLVLVLIPHIGTKIYGARRWINVAGFSFQPSEMAKLALIFYQAYIMSKFKNYKVKFMDIVYVLFLPSMLLTTLVLLEPDLGTALIFAGIAASMYFVGGGSLTHFAIMIPGMLAAIVGAILIHPYRLNRIKAFLDPSYDPQGASYQINQILISLANGGLLGVGIGGSKGKFDFIPEVHSDAIFAVIVEEFGFLGAVVFIGVILFLISRAIQIARGAKDMEGKIIAVGIVSLLAIQAFLNLASVVALTPLTGISLPFISYGGSSLLMTMISIGILTNIKRQS